MSFESRLYIPIFATERLMPSTGSLEVKVFFNSSEFLLMAAQNEAIPDCRLQIERLDLKLKRVQLSESASNHVSDMLAREKRLLYNIIDYEVWIV